ncbi:MAG: sugar isomerase [Candidatus Omnitrophota bacterium]|jgi:L-fucose isomerase-like protein|nr:MAG: sugar isomerase [Candidatus Omnitrophota bacterium]
MTETSVKSRKATQGEIPNEHFYPRRSFLRQSACLAAALGWFAPANIWAAIHEQAEERRIFLDDWNPQHDFLIWGRPLRVQPILMYTVPQPQPMRSWKSWGDVLTEAAAAEESERIAKELATLSEKAEFPLEILPPVKVKTSEEAKQAHKHDADVVLIYPASGSGSVLQSCVPAEGETIIFVRHRSGPIYYWYEALSVAYLATDKEESGSTPRLPNVHVDDVVVDEYDEVMWRLRALYGLKNFVGTKIVAVGGVWGKYAADAPQIARDRFKMDLIEIGYDNLEPLIKNAMADEKRMARAEKWTELYLTLPNTTLQTDRPFVVNAFLLYEIFKDLMREHSTPVFTIKECMSTILPISQTTACLTLGLLNDEGLLAFCESDFVIIPAGILLRHISGKPVFLHNSTFPHNGIVTCAHCSAPRRMDGIHYEPTILLTHEESEYGAAPKVEIPIGQEVTFIDPEYTKGRWLGFRGNVEDNPFFSICRSQQDVRIQGQWKKLISEVRDSHWMMVYGDYLKEVGYAARKLDLRWENISDA